MGSTIHYAQEDFVNECNSARLTPISCLPTMTGIPWLGQRAQESGFLEEKSAGDYGD